MCACCRHGGRAGVHTTRTRHLALPGDGGASKTALNRACVGFIKATRIKKPARRPAFFQAREVLSCLRPKPERQPKRLRPKLRPVPTKRPLPEPMPSHPKQLQPVPKPTCQRPEPMQQQRRLPEQQPGRSTCCKRTEPVQPSGKRGGGISS